MSDKFPGEASADRTVSNGFGAEMKHRYEEALSQLCLIGRINEHVSLLDDMPSLCMSIISTVLEFTPAENASIMLNDSETGSVRLFVAKGKGDRGSFIGRDQADATIMTLGEGVAGLVAEKGEIICINDCESDSRFVDLKAAGKKVSSLISAPIASDDDVLGVINCSHSRKSQFREIDKQNIALVADHAAVLVQRALALQQSRNTSLELQAQLRGKSASEKDARDKLAEMQEQLYRSEKFVTLGEMVAGIAHELNNRVAPILIYSQMLQQSVFDAQDTKRLQIIEESAKGAKAILETLLTYSREGTQEKDAFNINQILHNALTLTEYRIRNQGIVLSVDLSPHLPPAKIDDNQMAQVFLNIINNAIHAMEPEGGKLSVRSACEGSDIRITIADSGPGISEELAERIFNPFFTTKEEGKGTGLGLSISKRYIEENGGGIRVERSSLGGASFVITLPGVELKMKPSNGNGQQAEDNDKKVKILVVDDDSTIRDVIRDILGSEYEVKYATGGRDATEKIGADPPFDLVVIDYHMPEFDGKDLYEWIEDNHPPLKNRVIFSTGDIFHDKTHTFIDSTGCSCLVKPFTTKGLRETVSNALES